MANRPPPAILNRMPGVTKPGAAKVLSLLLYGAPGVGKTVFAGTADDDPRTSPVLYLDVEGGDASIAYRQDIDVWPIRNYAKDWREFQRYLTTTDHIPYKCVVIDSLTVLSDRLWEDVVDKTGHHDKATYDDWGAWTNRMKRNIAFLRDMDIHVIITALERKDDEGNIFPQLMTKNMSNDLPGAFDTVARLHIVTKPSADGKKATPVRRMLLAGDSRAIVKDRNNFFSALAPDILDPTVTKLLDRMDEGRRQFTAPKQRQAEEAAETA